MEKTYTKKTITHELAARMVAAAIARAKELDTKQNVAVLDEGGNLKAFGRMDGAPLLGIEGCQRKAFTALYGMSTADLYKRVKDDPSRLIGLSHFSRATVVGGGLPILLDGEVIGGIGVGGGTVEQDIACAEAGLDVLTTT
ncbi:MAG: hypothetical protein QOD06_1954 [Candidatus Binatota bacterium]|nr:hypothetical protein [Candidatus Binatota bacterium]